ncbi:MAG: Arc family DNA-binding protein [SAR202 cluster bacterium]|nr:Arc family DNA-binding protein [SAR202 cluster bacterium]
MAANLSIKNIPDDLLERLRERAKRNHRSLQGELMSIIEETVARDEGARAGGCSGGVPCGARDVHRREIRAAGDAARTVAHGRSYSADTSVAVRDAQRVDTMDPRGPR